MTKCVGGDLSPPYGVRGKGTSWAPSPTVGAVVDGVHSREGDDPPLQWGAVQGRPRGSPLRGDALMAGVTPRPVENYNNTGGLPRRRFRRLLAMTVVFTLSSRGKYDGIVKNAKKGKK